MSIYNSDSPKGKRLVVAFLKWSIEDALREAHNNFATFRQIPSIDTWLFLECAHGLSPEEATDLTKAVVLRGQARVFPDLRPSFTPRQESLLQRWPPDV